MIAPPSPGLCVDQLRHAVDHAVLTRIRGRIVQSVGPLLEAEFPGVTLGAMCVVGGVTRCEVVGFKEQRALLMPLEATVGVAFGTEVVCREDCITVPVGESLIGRVIDGLGHPMDGGPPLATRRRRRVSAAPPNPLQRSLIEAPIFTGVRAIDGFMPMGKGQRACIIAGSGVGKSTLMGMVAKGITADVNVICLLGERGREVREFVDHNLGPEGMKRTVVVAITSDCSPALKVKGAFLATTIAEYFRDTGRDVLLLMDSLTRFALAQRQIGLSAGEPPTTRGYTPSVFAMLPTLLERVGPGRGAGSITGLYTVLVEGDDLHDPIADAVRGIVDGHIVLSRKLASHGHFPPIDVLESLSRLADRVSGSDHQVCARRLRGVLATWAENEELIRLGAYRRGSSGEVDHAIDVVPAINQFLRQGVAEATSAQSTVAALRELASK